MAKEDKDQQIKDVMDADKRRGRSNRPFSSAEEKRKKEFVAGLLKVVAARDARALTELLQLYGITEGSQEWMRAWKVFYDA